MSEGQEHPPLPPPPAPASAVPPAYAVRPTNSLAIVSLVAGVACWVVVPFVGAIVAVVTGHIARSQIRRTGEGGDGMALAGLVLGYVHLAVVVIAVGLLILFLVGLAYTGSHVTTP